MNEVTAPASLGYAILLDQCPRCGGIWCDRWELYPVTMAGADRLDSVDVDALQRPTVAARAHLECPRCRARVRPFRDALLPPDARIERCPNCDGMWLNRGELRRFKHCHGSGFIPPTVSDNPITHAQLDRLAQKTSPVPLAEPVRDLANAFDAAAGTAEPGAVGKEIAASAAWLIARTALRLLLHV
jgi:Zn-finger nucleic acid-binding protein